MTKNASITTTTTTQDPQTTMAYLEAFKRLKRLKPIEPTLGILGLFFLTLFCFLFGFFYLDYRVIVKGFRFHGQPQKFLLLGGSNNESSSEKVGFLDGEKGSRECDLFDGEWVWDETYPLYQSKDCKLLDEGFRCSENGRPDDFYTKWRWQPQNCNLPRFDAKTMLEKLRNKRLAFVGDSIGRNQWESLLCMLSSVIPDKNSIYEVNGSPITKHNGFLVFMFRDYNCTIEYYRAPFLVIQGRAPSGSPKEVKTTLRLDRLDWTSWQWRDADILIFNTGHWWNYEKTIRGGCYFQEGEEIKMNMTVPEAYQRSLETLVDWIGREVNVTKTQVFFRTYAPVHFRGGDWKTGGSCHLEKVPAIGLPLLPSQTWPELHIFNNVLSNYSNKTRLSSLDILNVTQMTSRRKDGHSSLYYSRAGRAPLHRQDCSHWCLPGVPDTWNEILYALFLRNYEARTQHSTKHHSQRQLIEDNTSLGFSQ